MIHVGLTGNIASGKSTVAELFCRWGATIIDADLLAREAQRAGTPVFQAIVERFGPGVVGPDGELDRRALRARVMGEAAELAALNAIVHPEVRRRAAALVGEARRAGTRIVVSDIPLLFETDDPERFDAVVLVDAPAAVRRERLMRDRGLSASEADGMMAAQLPAAAKRARSTYIIDNDGSLPVLEQRSRSVWERLEAADQRRPC
jgi:dephospho-CoA kinase